MKNLDIIKIFKALGDESRYQIFQLLIQNKHKCLCGCDILQTMQLTQPTLSHHMKILCDANIVIANKNWKWTHYSINPETINNLIKFFYK